jgi:hypothetical protein
MAAEMMRWYWLSNLVITAQFPLSVTIVAGGWS